MEVLFQTITFKIGIKLEIFDYPKNVILNFIV